MPVVDLNADMGETETFPNDDVALMPLITSANISCGVHAGNAEVISRTVALAIETGVMIGAHPGLDDRASFGRRELPLGPPEVGPLIEAQIASLMEIAVRLGARLRHVKPHGALYNMAARQRPIAEAIAETVRRIDPTLTLVGLSGSESIRAAQAAGLTTASEAFADRAYLGNGSLMPRGAVGALLHDPDTVAARAVKLVLEGCVTAADGTVVPLTVDTICIHGDTPGAVTLAQAVRSALDAAGVSVSARR